MEKDYLKYTGETCLKYINYLANPIVLDKSLHYYFVYSDKYTFEFLSNLKNKNQVKKFNN